MIKGNSLRGGQSRAGGLLAESGSFHPLLRGSGTESEMGGAGAQMDHGGRSGAH